MLLLINSHFLVFNDRNFFQFSLYKFSIIMQYIVLPAFTLTNMAPSHTHTHTFPHTHTHTLILSQRLTWWCKGIGNIIHPSQWYHWQSQDIQFIDKKNYSIASHFGFYRYFNSSCPEFSSCGRSPISFYKTNKWFPNSLIITLFVVQSICYSLQWHTLRHQFFCPKYSKLNKRIFFSSQILLISSLQNFLIMSHS